MLIMYIRLPGGLVSSVLGYKYAVVLVLAIFMFVSRKCWQKGINTMSELISPKRGNVFVRKSYFLVSNPISH